MPRNKVDRDPIPKRFKSVEEAAEFWDSHDLADYWDLTQEAHFEVDIQRGADGEAATLDLRRGWRMADGGGWRGVSVFGG